jgi:hypothetical protein
MDEASISCLHPFLITGKICLKSPPKTTETPPNGYIDHHKTLYRAWFGQMPQNNNDVLSVPHPILLILNIAALSLSLSNPQLDALYLIILI